MGEVIRTYILVGDYRSSFVVRKTYNYSSQYDYSILMDSDLYARTCIFDHTRSGLPNKTCIRSYLYMLLLKWNQNLCRYDERWGEGVLTNFLPGSADLKFLRKRRSCGVSDHKSTRE